MQNVQYIGWSFFIVRSYILGLAERERELPIFQSLYFYLNWNNFKIISFKQLTITLKKIATLNACLCDVLASISEICLPTSTTSMIDGHPRTVVGAHISTSGYFLSSILASNIKKDEVEIWFLYNNSKCYYSRINSLMTRSFT